MFIIEQFSIDLSNFSSKFYKLHKCDLYRLLESETLLKNTKNYQLMRTHIETSFDFGYVALHSELLAEF